MQTMPLLVNEFQFFVTKDPFKNDDVQQKNISTRLKPFDCQNHLLMWFVESI
jgi:hypothetical protein